MAELRRRAEDPVEDEDEAFVRRANEEEDEGEKAEEEEPLPLRALPEEERCLEAAWNDEKSPSSSNPLSIGRTRVWKLLLLGMV